MHCSDFSITLSSLQNYGIMNLQDHGLSDSACHFTHRFWRFPKPMLPIWPSKPMLPIPVQKECILLLCDFHQRSYKSLFESRHVADKEEKGDPSRNSTSEEQERDEYVKHDGAASLFLRPDGQAMGDLEALDPSSIPAGQAAHCRATRDCQCHALRLAQWLPVALAAP